MKVPNWFASSPLEPDDDDTAGLVVVAAEVGATVTDGRGEDVAGLDVDELDVETVVEAVVGEELFVCSPQPKSATASATAMNAAALSGALGGHPPPVEDPRPATIVGTLVPER
jgi:hypothetical protein